MDTEGFCKDCGRPLSDEERRKEQTTCGICVLESGLSRADLMDKLEMDKRDCCAECGEPLSDWSTNHSLDTCSICYFSELDEDDMESDKLLDTTKILLTEMKDWIDGKSPLLATELIVGMINALAPVVKEMEGQ